MARLARGLREGNTEAGHRAHLYGASAGMMLGAVAILVTWPLALVAWLLHPEKPGAPVQQNHPNLKGNGNMKRKIYESI